MQQYELQYFGSVIYYSYLINTIHVNLSLYETYQKAHHPNRMWLAGPNNLSCLSVPLLGGRNVKGTNADLKIAQDENWQRIHWRTIHDAYRKSL